MTASILNRLEEWKAAGIISPEQHDVIARIAGKDRFSVYVELNVLLYLGVLSLIGGLEWTVQTYFSNLGDVAILSALTGLVAVSFYYCFSRALPFSVERVESPNLAFDYILYFGCLLFAVELGYLEVRFQFLRTNWDWYLLFSALVFFALAYRFDNRFVLSLGLSSLAAWFGVGSSRIGFLLSERSTSIALAYGLFVSAAGLLIFRLGLKKHFLDTYLHVAANVLFIALTLGVFNERESSLYLFGLILLAAITIAAGIVLRRFAFVVYAAIYGYIGVSKALLRNTSDTQTELAYFVVSGTIVIVSLLLLARRFAREA